MKFQVACLREIGCGFPIVANRGEPSPADTISQLLRALPHFSGMSHHHARHANARTATQLAVILTTNIHGFRKVITDNGLHPGPPKISHCTFSVKGGHNARAASVLPIAPLDIYHRQVSIMETSTSTSVQDLTYQYPSKTQGLPELPR